MLYHVQTGELDMWVEAKTQMKALESALKDANCPLGLLATVMKRDEKENDKTKYFNVVIILRRLGLMK